MSILYGIVDTAQDERLYDLVRVSPHHDCLFMGDLDPDVRRTAPYIVNLDTARGLAHAWNTEGRGQNWGIQFFSERSLANLRRHFRHFLQARLPDGSVVFFRFYDPRIWTAYLPTCSEVDLQRWFEGIDEYIAETNTSERLVYLLERGRLRSKGKALAYA